jgi:hypothetical protein
MCRFTGLCASLLILAPLFACGPAPAAATKKGVEEAAQAEADSPGKTVSVSDLPTKAIAGPSSVEVGAGNAPHPSLRDPAWFRPTIFAGATVLKEGRAPADEAGLFASQITLQLADGTDIDACVEELMAAVGADVPGLAVEDQGDRRSIKGATEHYQVTLLCGEAKGHMTAYVSYTWTSLPTGA